MVDGKHSTVVGSQAVAIVINLPSLLNPSAGPSIVLDLHVVAALPVSRVLKSLKLVQVLVVESPTPIPQR